MLFFNLLPTGRVIAGRAVDSYLPFAFPLAVARICTIVNF